MPNKSNFSYPAEEVVFDEERPFCSEDWIPDKLEQAIVWLQKKLEKIPAEYRGTASFEIDSNVEYDCSILTMKISYHRPATNGEVWERLVASERSIAAIERRDRARYLQLKKRFEP